MGQHQTPFNKKPKERSYKCFKMREEKDAERVESGYVNVEGASLISSSRYATLKR